MRSRWVFFSQAALACLVSCSASPDVLIVDTHAHLWDLKRPAGLGWIAKDNETFTGIFFPSSMPRSLGPTGWGRGTRSGGAKFA